MQKEVIILGAGGHAKVIAEIITKSGDEVIGFLDDNEAVQGKEIYLGKKVLGKISDVTNYPNAYAIIAIGSNNVRRMLAEKCDLKWYMAIHPSAIIASDVKIGEGTAIMPGVVINPGSVIGKHAIINTCVSIDHDNIIDDYVHISPGAHLAGTVHIKEGSWICTGAAIINNITIAKDVIAGAGAVIIKDIEESGTYIGVPARKK